MEITPQIKERVVAALLADMEQRKKSHSDYAKFIKTQHKIPFDKSAWSQIKKADGRNAIKDSSWLKLARHFNVLDASKWQKANTKTFQIINEALNMCKKNGTWQVLCDKAGVGKTFTAKYYAKQNKQSVVYIDFSQCLSKSDFILELAKSVGVEHTGTYNQLWKEATDALLLLEQPMLIADEIADAPDSVITLLKGLYNKADMGDHIALGAYFIGADNLRKRLTDGRKRKKQSYAEFWSRIDNNIAGLGFSNVADEYLEQLREDVEMIIDVNLPAEIQDKREEIITATIKTGGSRAARKNINKELSIKYISAI